MIIFTLPIIITVDTTNYFIIYTCTSLFYYYYYYYFVFDLTHVLFCVYFMNYCVKCYDQGYLVHLQIDDVFVEQTVRSCVDLARLNFTCFIVLCCVVQMLHLTGLV